MKSFYSIAILFLIGIVFISGNSDYNSAKKTIAELGVITSNTKNDDYNVYSTPRFNAVSGESLEVSTSGGSITVTGSGNDEAVIKMFVRRSGRYLQASDTDLSNFEIQIEKSGNKVIASAQ